MYNGKKILTLIPARGGSKGLPGKNLRLLAGKPLIVRTIEAAKKCASLDKIVVSTDDEEIADISRKAGAETPFLRPEEFACDTAKGIEVIFHAIEWLEKKNEYYDILLLLQPTSPLRTDEDIQKALTLLFDRQAGAIVSVCESGHHPYWSNVLPADRSMKDFINTKAVKNRQELPIFYRLNGAIYLAYIEYLKKEQGFWGAETFAYIMSGERSVDIDSALDLKLAEVILKEQHKVEG